MDALQQVIQLEIWLWLGGLIGVVVYQMLTGRINLHGLLDAKDGSGDVSPGRLQLLAFTLAGAALLLFQVAQNPSKFPEVSPEFLLFVGGSNAGYLLGKWNSFRLNK